MLGEVKGAELRKQVCASGRRLRRQALGFLDAYVALLERRQVRVLVADSRTKPQNAVVAHSILTRKLGAVGDVYPHLAETPVYGHSENHVGLQLADLRCSSLLFPMAVAAYCQGHVSSLHVRPGYEILRARFGRRLQTLQHRYREGRAYRGGITVSDAIGGRPGRLLFTPPSRPASPAP